VLCPTPSPIAEQARAAGASIVGEDDLIASIKEGVINFDRLICHRDTNAKLNGARIARILGPKGLMPNTKHGTVVSDIGKAVRGLVGGAEYRERVGVIRLAIGNLSLSPEELARNIKVLIESIKKDSAQMSDKIAKEIHEVVSFSTHPLS
jgi:large subunit ribosomal protein L1